MNASRKTTSSAKSKAALQESLNALLRGTPGHAHLMGVCGVGVAGVARLLAARGWQVSGCDASPDGAIMDWLNMHGVTVAERHDAAHLPTTQGQPMLVVHTTAVPENHPELRAARAAGAIVCRRGEALAAMVNQSRGVAICGAHGKTTTTCFTTRLLHELDADPSWCIGGTTSTLGGVAGVGAGDLLVVEADESDGTLAHYQPDVTVLTNIDLDHLEHFAGEDDLMDCYRQVVRQTRAGLAFCSDNDRAAQVAAAWKGRAIPFGLGPQAVLRAIQLELSATGVGFDVLWQNQTLGRVTLAVPGNHNVLNALGALAAAILLGHDPQRACEQLTHVAELPSRRFERVASMSGIQVIADYAHHPAEIAALVSAARLQNASRILAIFQPHRYTRTQALGTAFPAAFDGVDEVVLTPVYAASETPLEGGGIADLYAHFRQIRPRMSVKLARSLEEAWAGVRRLLKPGDLLLIVGAGDIVRIAGQAGAALRAHTWGEDTPISAHPDAPSIRVAGEALARIPGVTVAVRQPLSGLLYYGVGGPADVWADIATPDALAAVLSWASKCQTPVHLLGSGSNTWASDLGVEGIVVRVRGEAFLSFSRTGTDVEIGCGWNGPALLDRLEEAGLSGLEFLEGVPGCLGGWLAMNAGAHGGEIGSHVRLITCLNADGTDSIVKHDACGFRYRHCDALTQRVACRATLHLAEASPEAIRNKRKAFREKRIPLAGLRTEGSVFCNPPGDFAGRLLDAAGCKALRIGGAAVCEHHANVVVVSGNATASDVLALLARMRARAERQSGVRLELENRMLGLMTADDALPTA